MAHITIDNNNLLVLDCQTDGCVDTDEGLTTARVERGEEDDVAVSCLTCHELQIGTENAECLVDDIALA